MNELISKLSQLVSTQKPSRVLQERSGHVRLTYSLPTGSLEIRASLDGTVLVDFYFTFADYDLICICDPALHKLITDAYPIRHKPKKPFSSTITEAISAVLP